MPTAATRPSGGAPADLLTVAREWGRIGCTGFGGPPAHIALLRRLCVERRGWLEPSEFEDAIAACNLLPGPASTQLAIFCAWRVRGRAGAIVGGACFILPGPGRDPRPRRRSSSPARRRSGSAARAPARAPPSRPSPCTPDRASSRTAGDGARQRAPVGGLPRRGCGGGGDARAVARARPARLRRWSSSPFGSRAAGAAAPRAAAAAAARGDRRRRAACSRSPGSRSRSARCPTAAAS